MAKTQNLSVDRARLPAATLARRQGARIATLHSALPVLQDPVDASALSLTDAGTTLTSASAQYPLQFGCPVLLPSEVLPFVHEGRLSMHESDANTALTKYFYRSVINHWSETNADPKSAAFETHLARLQSLLDELTLPKGGLVLDVGCDNVSLGAAHFPDHMTYLGLDTFASPGSPFHLLGCAEFLPLADECVDIVLFNTSLDHVQDYRTAVDEAKRVMKPGGLLIIASLIWTERAELYHDRIHSHHFRLDDIMSATNGLAIYCCKNYNYKSDTNRHGAYFAFQKPLPP